MTICILKIQVSILLRLIVCIPGLLRARFALHAWHLLNHILALTIRESHYYFHTKHRILSHREVTWAVACWCQETVPGTKSAIFLCHSTECPLSPYWSPNLCVQLFTRKSTVCCLLKGTCQYILTLLPTKKKKKANYKILSFLSH